MAREAKPTQEESVTERALGFLYDVHLLHAEGLSQSHAYFTGCRGVS